MPRGVTLQQINQIFAILERLSISREAVVIPLWPQSPGQVRMLASGKLEILVDADTPFDRWLSGLEGLIRKVIEGD
jgi:hypothetical protein